MGTLMDVLFSIVCFLVLAENRAEDGEEDEGYDLYNFPMPDSIECQARPRARNGYVCDLDGSLSRRSVKIIQKTFSRSSLNLVDCSQQTERILCPNVIADRGQQVFFESIHLVLVNKVRLENSSQCVLEKSDKDPGPTLRVEELAHKSLMRFSTSLLALWNGRQASTCIVDVLFLYVKTAVLCDHGVLLTLRSGDRPMLAIAIGGQLAVAAAMNEDVLQGSLNFITDQNNRNSTLVAIPQRTEAALTAFAPILDILRRTRSHLMKLYACRLHPLPNYKIPSWAITTLAVSTVLIVLCTPIGYLASKHSRSLRICDPNPFMLIDFNRRNRKWRAGFVGGLI